MGRSVEQEGAADPQTVITQTATEVVTVAKETVAHVVENVRDTNLELPTIDETRDQAGTEAAEEKRVPGDVVLHLPARAELSHVHADPTAIDEDEDDSRFFFACFSAPPSVSGVASPQSATNDGAVKEEKPADKLKGTDAQPNANAPAAEVYPVVPNSRIWKLIAPDWMYVAIGVAGAAMVGVIMPLNSFLLSTSVAAFSLFSERLCLIVFRLHCDCIWTCSI